MEQGSQPRVRDRGTLRGRAKKHRKGRKYGLLSPLQSRLTTKFDDCQAARSPPTRRTRNGVVERTSTKMARRPKRLGTVGSHKPRDTQRARLDVGVAANNI